jgi:hypothetical protein
MTLSHARASLPVALHTVILDSIISSDGSVSLRGRALSDSITTTTFFFEPPQHYRPSTTRYKPLLI